MSVYEINPLLDPRWSRFAGIHPRASAFHTVAWLRALQETYAYEPIAFTTSPPGTELQTGLVFCIVHSWLTGSRLVSLPFADHCEPLVESMADFASLTAYAIAYAKRHHLGYVEIRPIHHDPETTGGGREFAAEGQYVLQILDLRTSLWDLYQRFDKHCVRRRLRRSERGGLQYEEGSSPELLAQFYRMMVITRRKHHIPPQPVKWFRSLLDNFGSAATLRVVSKGDVPVAGVLTLQHGRVGIYKYGCSDPAFKHLAGTPLLIWKAIQDAKRRGSSLFDFGRSDMTNRGLMVFKQGWGTYSLPLTYWSSQHSRLVGTYLQNKVRQVSGSVLSRLPDPLLVAAGNVLYRHAG